MTTQQRIIRAFGYATDEWTSWHSKDPAMLVRTWREEGPWMNLRVWAQPSVISLSMSWWPHDAESQSDPFEHFELHRDATWWTVAKLNVAHRAAEICGVPDVGLRTIVAAADWLLKHHGGEG